MELNAEMLDGATKRVEFRTKVVVCNEAKSLLKIKGKKKSEDLTVTVKGLTGYDYHHLRNRANDLYSDLFSDLLESFRTGDSHSLNKIKKDLTGTLSSSDENRNAYDVQKKLFFVMGGLVDSDLEESQLLTIFNLCPIVFYRLYDEIEKLSLDLVCKKKP
jgi:hypothetical protein